MASEAWTDRALLDCVKRLAAPAEQQVAYLAAFGSLPSVDELALEFHDEFVRVATRRNPYVERLREIDDKLAAMSGAENAEVWTADALKRAEWREVRQLAAAAVKARSS